MRLSRTDVRERQPIHVDLQRGASGSNLLDLLGNGGNSLQGLAGLAQQLGPILQLALQQNSQHAGALQQQQRVLPQYQLRGFSPGGSAQPAPLALADAGAGDAPTDATAGAAQHNSAAGAGAKDDPPAANEELDLATATAALYTGSLVAAADAAAAKAAKKKPAASAKASGKAKAVACKKRPAARGGGGGGGGAHPVSAAARIRARPEGCGKCRGKPGCSPSCWRNGTNPY